MPSHRRPQFKRSLGAGIAAALLAVPAAQASPMLEPGSGDASPLPDSRTTTIDQGFDWGSAAIGAGGAGALLILTGMAGVASQGRRRGTRPVLDGPDAGRVIRHRQG